MTTRRFTLIAIGLFVLSVFVRVNSADLNEPLAEDQLEYHSLAVQVLRGNGFIRSSGEPTAWRTPGYPLVLASSMVLLGEGVFRLRLLMILLSSASVVALMILASMLSKERTVPILAGVLLAINTSSIAFSGLLLAETLAQLLLIISSILVIRAESSNKAQRWIFVALAGLIGGYAVLVRGYLVFAVLCFPAYLLSRRAIRPALACAIFLAVIPSIWIARNVLVMGVPTLSTQSYEVIWYGVNPYTRGSWNGDWIEPDSLQRAYLSARHPGVFELSEAERALVFRRQAITEVTDNPERVFWLLPRKLVIYLSPWSYAGTDWTYLFGLPISLCGIYVFWKRSRFKLWLILFPILAVGLINLITFGDPRFRFPIVYAFIILTSVALVGMYQRIAKVTDSNLI